MTDSGSRRFNLSDDAREYFEKIGVERKKGDSKSGMFSAYVEPYYLCMLMGMVKNQKRKPDLMSKDMVRTWKSSAKEFEKEISGFIFYKFCLDRGISDGDDRILKLMENFFANERVEVYNKEAFSMMNHYAQGGFDFIRENLGPCNQLADFLVWYLQELEGMY
tara:strand:+ start:102 stop:590 length:489 start_codon:yes stop_codon:yes gene_type:complete